MKNTRKLMAFILAVLMLMSSLAVSSLAIPNDYQPIDAISLNLKRNIAGKSPSDYEEFLAINTPGVSFDAEAIDEIGIPFFVYKYDYSGPELVISKGIAPVDAQMDIGKMPYRAPIYKFAADTSYYVELYLELDNGYILDSPYPLVTINGIEVEAYANSPFYVSVYFAFTAEANNSICAIFNNLLSRLTDDGKFKVDVRSDIAGLTPEDYDEIVTIKTPGFSFDEEYTVMYANDVEGDHSLSSDEAFVAGKEYELHVYFIKDNGSDYFNDDTVVTVNGKRIETWDYNPDNLSQAYIEYTITATEQGSVPATGDFFQMIADFFANIIDTIKGAFERKPV